MSASLPPPPSREFLAVIPFDFEPIALGHEMVDRIIRRAEELAKKEAVDFVKKFAQNHGYSISIVRSKRTGRKLHSSIREVVYMACAHSGNHRQRVPDSRTYNSNKTGCPFQLRLILRYDYWSLEYENVSHNHDTTVS